MTRSVLAGSLIGVAALAVGCATRIPVVTTPAFPSYLYPPVPAEYAGSPEAGRYEEAWTFFQAGDLLAAEERYTTILEASPAFYPAEVGLGWLNLAREDSQAAAGYFDRAVARQPTYVPGLLGRGESMLALDQTEEALSAFEQALSVDPGLPDVQRVVRELRFAVISERLEVAREDAAAERFAAAKSAYERVIAASPNSAFLHVELGRVEFRQGNLDLALGHARRAVELDPVDPAALLLEGELHEASGDVQAAILAVERLDRLDPTEETARWLERLNERVRLAELPPEVLAISSKTAVTRGELAALIGTRFPSLLRDAAGWRTVIITDTRDYWGHLWILDVTQAGVMGVDAGYRFEPAQTVRRGELAGVIDAMLDLFAEIDPAASARWAGETPDFSDMRRSHLSYMSAARAVAAGVLDVLEEQTFQPTRAADGREVVEAIDRLAELAREFQ